MFAKCESYAHAARIIALHLVIFILIVVHGFKMSADGHNPLSCHKKSFCNVYYFELSRPTPTFDDFLLQHYDMMLAN